MSMDSVFTLRRPSGKALPLIVSAPHVGTLIPPDLSTMFHPEMLQNLQDTDWLIHELYGFCVAAGATMLHARYSRYVIDLNRPVEGPALYSDRRLQTDAMPLTDFDGVELYRQLPAAGERERRVRLYHEPYHRALRAEIERLQTDWPQVLVFDAHSIRRHVAAIDPLPFPDLILGDRDGSSAGAAIVAAVRAALAASPFQVSYNHPFKGGHITRSCGQPQQGVHALQLEMSQDLYLCNDRIALDNQKVRVLQPVLEKLLNAAVQAMR